MDERNRPVRSRRMGDQPRKISDGFAMMTVVQVIVCGLLLCSLFLYTKIQQTDPANVKETFGQVTQEGNVLKEGEQGNLFEQISGAIREFFFGTSSNDDGIAVHSVDPNEESNEETTSSADKTASFISSDSSTSDHTIYKVQGENTGGQGGQMQVTAQEGELLYPPEGYSLAPAVLSQKMVAPVDAEITSPYGYRIHPITGETDFHTGIDLGASMGTPIRAAFSGTVTEIGESEIFGNYIVVTHSDSLSTRYCHCNKIVAEKGAVIRQGETIAKVGTTGMSTGPHLHFEIKINGVNVDPEPFLPQAQQSVE